MGSPAWNAWVWKRGEIRKTLLVTIETPVCRKVLTVPPNSFYKYNWAFVYVSESTYVFGISLEISFGGSSKNWFDELLFFKKKLPQHCRLLSMASTSGNWFVITSYLEFKWRRASTNKAANITQDFKGIYLILCIPKSILVTIILWM